MWTRIITGVGGYWLAQARFALFTSNASFSRCYACQKITKQTKQAKQSKQSKQSKPAKKALVISLHVVLAPLRGSHGRDARYSSRVSIQ